VASPAAVPQERIRDRVFLQLEAIDVALYLIVSWRIARLMRFGRTCRDLLADLFFDQDERHGAYPLDKRQPTAERHALNQVLRLVAMLGSFLRRQGDGEPSVKTIGIGLHKS